MILQSFLLKALCGGLLVGGAFWSSDAIAQSNSDLPSTTLSQRSPQLIPPQPLPDTSLSLSSGRVTVRLINTTGTDVVFLAYGQTEPQRLPGRSNVTLNALNTPANLNFYRPDRGFLIVTLSTPASDTVEVTLTQSANQDQGRSSLVVNSRGEVFVY